MESKITDLIVEHNIDLSDPSCLDKMKDLLQKYKIEDTEFYKALLEEQDKKDNTQ